MTSVAEIIQATGIGASEIAAVMGVSPYDDPWTIYARKHELIGPKEQTEAMFWGKTLEPIIAQVFSRRMDLPVIWWDRRVYSEQRPWQYASPDAFIVDEDDPSVRRAILECKTAALHQSGHWSQDSGGEDGIPEHYLAQVEWQMSVCQLDLAYLAVLIAGNDYRVYKIPHDPALEEILLEKGEAFWREHIMTKAEPPMSGSDDARDYLRKRYPHEREQLRPATLQETEWLNQYAELRRLLDQGEARKKELENQITQAIGNAEGLKWECGKLTWKRIKDRALTDWKELAKSQIARFSEDEQKDFIGQYTHTEPGYRRIYFRDEAAQ